MLRALGIAMVVIGLSAGDSEGLLLPVLLIAAGLFLAKVFDPERR